MTTYIPSLFILAIAQITVYFKNEHFKTSVPVAVTSLLGNYLFWMKYCEDWTLFAVMYTLYTSVSKFLPPTSYMKAIEWWLLFHILVPLIIFVVLFLQVLSTLLCLFTWALSAGAHSKAYGAPRSPMVPHRRLRPPLCCFWRSGLAFCNIFLRHCLCFHNVDALLWSNVQLAFD